MPDGSSSAAPVISPGPRFLKNLCNAPCGSGRTTSFEETFYIHGQSCHTIALRFSRELLERVIMPFACSDACICRNAQYQNRQLKESATAQFFRRS
jgi:hypothetical protein